MDGITAMKQLKAGPEDTGHIDHRDHRRRYDE